MKHAPVLINLALASSILSGNSYAQNDLTPGAIPAAPQEIAPVPAIKGQLAFKVIIVDDLVPKPVPFNDFTIQAVDDTGALIGDPQTVRTGDEGTVSASLAPGKYVLQSVKPLKFKGNTYDWKSEFTITDGQVTSLQLTGDDATIHSETIPAVRQIADEAKVYRSLEAGVATVESESGQGSGFLIDANGLILTNHHVIENSKNLVVRFRPGMRVPARLIADDAAADVAIIRVNPASLKDLPIIPLALPKTDSTELPVIEGEKVLAIGSPLGEEKILTTGLVSRVKQDVIISDVNINPGNSGGPLLNLAGEAIGITSFMESTGQGGPGLSGIVSINKAVPLLKKAKDSVDADKSGATIPPDTNLPDVSPIKVPADLLTAAAQTNLEAPMLKAPADFETYFLTPFISASQESKKERDLAKKKDKRRDKQGANGTGEGGQNPTSTYYEERDAVIRVVVAPKLVESKGSQRKGIFGAMLGVSTRKTFDFRHEFYDMELLRDGVKVEPLRRKRATVAVYQSNAKDSAYGGVYDYDPSVFRPEGKLELRVQRDFNIDKWDTVRIAPALQAKLYNQFVGYWAFAGSADASASAK